MAHSAKCVTRSATTPQFASTVSNVTMFLVSNQALVVVTGLQCPFQCLPGLWPRLENIQSGSNLPMQLLVSHMHHQRPLYNLWQQCLYLNTRLNLCLLPCLLMQRPHAFLAGTDASGSVNWYPDSGASLMRGGK